jgi:hypothetical protein
VVAHEASSKIRWRSSLVLLDLFWREPSSKVARVIGVTPATKSSFFYFLFSVSTPEFFKIAKGIPCFYM